MALTLHQSGHGHSHGGLSSHGHSHSDEKGKGYNQISGHSHDNHVDVEQKGAEHGVFLSSSHYFVPSLRIQSPVHTILYYGLITIHHNDVIMECIMTFNPLYNWLHCPVMSLSGRRAQQANASVRAAFVHVVGDLLQSVSVLVSAIIIFFKVTGLCVNAHSVKSPKRLNCGHCPESLFHTGGLSSQIFSSAENTLTQKSALGKVFCFCHTCLLLCLVVLCNPNFLLYVFFQPEYKIADPICTFLFSILVLCTTFAIMRDILIVLMEGE